MAIHGLFFVYIFILFKHQYNHYSTYECEKLSKRGIQTHDLLDMSLLP